MPVKERHQVLMLDEIAIEKRPRWDDRTNMILGMCREHSKAIPLEFNTEKELDLLCDGLDNGSIHLASAGLCKCETGPQHATFIRTILEASEYTSLKSQTGLQDSGKPHYRTVSIASDGESKWRDALVDVTMRHKLSVQSPIYSKLHKLEMMSFLVGENNITADKDPKHIFKQRNLWMWNKGVFIKGICITPSLLKIHLQLNCVS